jgi:hypothetical protein
MMKITVNGRQYGSVDEMPAPDRQLYDSALATVGNETKKAGNEPRVNVTTKTRITLHGKEYGSVDELPADVRRLYEAAMKSDPDRMSLIATAGPGKMGWLVAGIVLGAGAILLALSWMS